MKKKLLLFLLVLCMMLVLLPGKVRASSLEGTLPDWYFLFAIFKNVDVDCKDANGVITHTTYTMTQEEADLLWKHARMFEEYMNQVGVMRAHVEVVEIDAPVTELQESDYGSWIGPEQAVPFLKDKVDLDQYDYVFCAVSLNVSTGYWGLTGGSYENGTGHSCVNTVNQEFMQWIYGSPNTIYTVGVYVHEFLHFMEQMNRKWGVEFNLHDIEDKFYTQDKDDYMDCYTDIILNQVKGSAETGTGVIPVAWQYPPHVIQSIQFGTVMGLQVAKAGTKSLKLQWKPQEYVSGYMVYRYQPDKKDWKLIKTLMGKNQNSYDDRNRKPATTYWYYIVSYLNMDMGKPIYSKPSEVIRATTLSKSLKTPVLKAKQKGKKAVLTWKKVANASGYEIYISLKNKKNFKKIKTIKAESKASYSCKLSAKTCYFKMRAYQTVNGQKVYGDYSKIRKIIRQ